MTVRLFDYQEQALQAEAGARRDHPDETRLLIQMATGLGKTVTFATDAVRYLDSFDGAGNRVLILVHTDELAEQTEATVRLCAGSDNTDGAVYSVGVVKAGRDEVTADIIVASVQTLANPERRARITDVGKIVVDEAHLSIAPTYQEIIRYYGGMPVHQYDEGPYIPVTGYTATPRRGDGQSLGAVWQNLVFSRSTSWAVRHGFLANPRGYAVTVPEIGISTTDAAADQAIVDSIAPEKMVAAWQEHAAGRPTVLFAPLVRSAQEFAWAFQKAGISAAVVWGEMPKDERRRAVADYKAGRITVLCNAMALIAGFDAPRTSCVAWCRPVGNQTAYVQGMGRGMRIDRTSAVPWAEQDAVLLVLAGQGPPMNVLADLSDRPLEPGDGRTLLEMEDEYDLSRDLLPDAPNAYAGRVDVTEFDPLLARSEKVWIRTKGGALAVPVAKDAYLAILPDSDGYAVAFVGRHRGHREVRNVPDLDLAMLLAEDRALDAGGDFGRLIADKTRPWRKGVPSAAAMAEAQRLGLGRELAAIVEARAGGKAGRLADLINREKASRLIDPAVRKLTEGAA